MSPWDDFDSLSGENPAPPEKISFNPDDITLSLRDEAGGIHEIRIGDLATQFNAASREMVSSWECASPRDLQHMDIEIRFTDSPAPLKQNFMSFLDRNRDEIALFQLAHEAPQLLKQVARNPKYQKYGL